MGRLAICPILSPDYPQMIRSQTSRFRGWQPFILKVNKL
jgi:hypothetical protein